MNPQTLVKHFGNKRRASKALNVSRQTIYNWIKAGKVPEWAALVVRNAK